MRQKFDAQRYFNWSTATGSKIVRRYEEEYNRISQILDENPGILNLVDKDLKKLSRPNRRGRKATYTSENLLRALIVLQKEKESFRGAMIRISHSLFLQDFLRLGVRSVPDYTLIERAFKAIQPQTWKGINDVLTSFANKQGCLDPSKIRTDTTVVDGNIHYPTDTSLLWDSWRVLYRLLQEGRRIRGVELDQRFHERKVKKLYLFITRYCSSPCKKRQRAVRKKQKRLIAQAERIFAVAQAFSKAALESQDLALKGLGVEIRAYLLKIRKVIDATSRAWLRGEVVPAADRIFSIFEDHVELIKRGRRDKPVEFGHMVLLAQTQEKFITQYDVMDKRIPDSKLPDKVLQKHKETFGSLPDTLAADKGFCGDAEAMAELRRRVKVVAIPQRLRDYADDAFVALQNFRAGIEGTISVLKRAFRLFRCPFRGFKSFESYVALGVFCHNLVVLAAT